MILTLQIPIGNDHLKHHGLRAWGCGLALAEHISRLDLQGLSAVDLGCGIGIVGITAAKRGADVTLVDWDATTCNVARQNVQFNAANCEVSCADWNSIQRQFDCVFGSEIAYSRYSLETLAGTINRIWNRNGPCVLAVNTGCLYREQFAGCLESFGLRVDQLITAESAYQLMVIRDY